MIADPDYPKCGPCRQGETWCWMFSNNQETNQCPCSTCDKCPDPKGPEDDGGFLLADCEIGPTDCEKWNKAWGDD